jgi:hypothetical protein
MNEQEHEQGVVRGIADGCRGPHLGLRRQHQEAAGALLQPTAARRSPVPHGERDMLPMDVVDLILAYDGSIKKRWGRYCNQLRRDDPRYRMVSEICRPIVSWLPIYGGGHVFLNLSKLIVMVEFNRIPDIPDTHTISYNIRSRKTGRPDQHYALV